MANIKTRGLSDGEYEKLISLLIKGYVDVKGVKRKGNRRVATALVAQANLGLRIGDVVKLRLCDFVLEGDNYKLNIVETKTGKPRHFTANQQIYTFLLNYAHDLGIGKNALLFDITVRNVQKMLYQVVQYEGLLDVGTHSFRKYFAMNHYERSGYDLRLIQHLLQHTSISTTERYLTVNQDKVNAALADYSRLPSIG